MHIKDNNLFIGNEPLKEKYTLNELAELLVEIYNKADKDGRKSYSPHIFGFKYGEAILNSGFSCLDIITAANENYSPVSFISDSYKKEIYKAAQLYVSVKSKEYGMCFIDDAELKPAEKPDKYDIEDENLEFNEKLKSSPYRRYLTAIKSKPFILLAGISGTGKSRIVRELARACWDEDSEEYKSQTPPNFEMVQVKPNWHDSSELLGYVSRISGEPVFIAGDFIKFIVKAWEYPNKPFFLCLDEMNLAPVEQYFAEYLSVIESRKLNENGVVTTDAILSPAFTRNPETNKVEIEKWYENIIKILLSKCPSKRYSYLESMFKKTGISIPQNLIVVGTVNMDETTFSFSRKVLDRAMTIEMNEVDLNGGLGSGYEPIGRLSNIELVGTAVEGKDVYKDYTALCDRAIDFLTGINKILNNTPFKVAYRTRNEFLLYVVNNLQYNLDIDGNLMSDDYVLARSLDEITSMKILSRIEGDSTKVLDSDLERLEHYIVDELKNLSSDYNTDKPVSAIKLQQMRIRLKSGFTSFWS